MKRYVGIDLAFRAKHRAVVLDGVESRGRSFAVDTTRDGFEELVCRAEEDADGPVSFVMEPTGLAWLPVAAYVSAAGHKVFLAKIQKASDLRKFYRKHTKTDVVDAVVVGRLPQLDPDGVHELIVPTAGQTTLRRLVKRRERLMREVGDQKRRVHAVLVMANPRLMAAFGETKFGRAKVAFLRKYVDPDKVVRLGRKRLEKFWTRHSKGKEGADVVQRVHDACCETAALYAALRQCGRLPFDYDEVQDEVRFELDRLERADNDAKELERRIAELHHQLDPNRTLEQLCGVGPTIAAAVDALVGDVERFSNGSRFVSYCGICPRRKQTGVSDPSMPITKTGQRLLKKYLYLAADVARQWDPDFAAYYARRYANGDHHNRILIALAQKMARRIYALLKRRAHARRVAANGEPVEPVGYVLRDAGGVAIDAKQARTLIKDKYARGVVAPDRDARERRRKGKAETPTSPKGKAKTDDNAKAETLSTAVSGRPLDATAGTTGPRPKTARTATTLEPLEQHLDRLRERFGLGTS